jgi:hypothetical protein
VHGFVREVATCLLDHEDVEVGDVRDGRFVSWSLPSWDADEKIDAELTTMDTFLDDDSRYVIPKEANGLKCAVTNGGIALRLQLPALAAVVAEPGALGRFKRMSHRKPRIKKEDAAMMVSVLHWRAAQMSDLQPRGETFKEMISGRYSFQTVFRVQTLRCVGASSQADRRGRDGDEFMTTTRPNCVTAASRSCSNRRLSWPPPLNLDR